MTRAEGWEARLIEVIEAAQSVPFQWGVHDCVTFACAGYEAVRGVRPYLPRRRYKTDRGAALYLKRHGFDDLEAAGRHVLGDPLDTVRLGQRGDIALGDAFGIVIGARVVHPGPTGLTAVPLDDVQFVWRL